MASQQDLPKAHRALVLTSRSEPPTVKSITTPQPAPGSAIVRILAANVVSYSREVYDGSRSYTYPTPLVTGSSAIGRIATVGPDATLLKPGQLVLFDSTIVAETIQALSCSLKFMAGEWRDSTYAEYAKLPLENCHALNEDRLLGKVENGGLGYSIENLVYISRLLVSYGRLRDIGLRTGETVVVAPATGAFGGAAVQVALAMGARVIAMGRNPDVPKKLGARSERIETVPVTGDTEADAEALRKFGTIDAFFDISPPMTANSTHIKSGILALRHGGRVSLMGGVRGDISIPYPVIMFRDIQLKGKWMYPREAVGEFLNMVEAGIMKLGESMGMKMGGRFALEDWDIAFTTAKDTGMQVIIAP